MIRLCICIGEVGICVGVGGGITRGKRVQMNPAHQ